MAILRNEATSEVKLLVLHKVKRFEIHRECVCTDYDSSGCAFLLKYILTKVSM